MVLFFMVEFLLFNVAAASLQTAHIHYATSKIWMANRGASPRNLLSEKSSTATRVIELGRLPELTLKGSLTSPTSLPRNVPVFVFPNSIK